jgi:hypothetical protein
MLKTTLYLLSVLATSTVVLAQCTNNACTFVNEAYKQCKMDVTTIAGFKTCLCTNQFLVNYERCQNGTVCAWDGNPDTLNNPCILIYCPGEFVGGFDAKEFCSCKSGLDT